MNRKIFSIRQDLIISRKFEIYTCFAKFVVQFCEPAYWANNIAQLVAHSRTNCKVGPRFNTRLRQLSVRVVVQLGKPSSLGAEIMCGAPNQQ